MTSGKSFRSPWPLFLGSGDDTSFVGVGRNFERGTRMKLGAAVLGAALAAVNAADATVLALDSITININGHTYSQSSTAA